MDTTKKIIIGAIGAAVASGTLVASWVCMVDRSVSAGARPKIRPMETAQNRTM